MPAMMRSLSSCFNVTRMGAAVEDVDAIAAVDRQRGNVSELPAVGQLRPVIDDAVAMLARAENGWFSCYCSLAARAAQAKVQPLDSSTLPMPDSSRISPPALSAFITPASLSSRAADLTQTSAMFSLG